MKSILVADDNMVSLRILQAILEKNGYHVLAAKDGLEAWDILTKNREVRIAILDWMMPGMSGIEICQKLQTEHHSGMLYVVLLTAREGKENVIYGLQQGASDYIVKPFEKEELLARLRVGERIMDLQRQLSQSQKLESIGQLAAGVAHEINTPAQYVSDNILFLQESFGDLMRLLGQYKQVIESGRRVAALNRQIEASDAMAKEVDEAYLIEEIPRAIEQSSQGIGHIAHIVRAMKQFAHPDSDSKEPTDINKAIENSVTVTRNVWKYTSEMELDLSPEIPLVHCFAAEINQVLLNVIVNAADAIGEMVGQSREKKGHIRITTRHQGSDVEIRISDTGPGIPQAIREKIFEPFFTTKPVGKGSGQGLAIAYAIVVEKHGGSLTFETEAGMGTTFIIRLPIGESEGEATSEESEMNLIESTRYEMIGDQNT